MSKNLQSYQVSGLSIPEINRVFSLIAQRLDQAQGVSGNADLHGKRIVRVGQGSRATDAVTKNQLALLVGGDNLGIEATVDEATGKITLALKIRASYGLAVSTNGLALKKQEHIVDATAVHTLTAPADTPATADALRDDLVTNTLPSIKTAVDNLGAKLNALLLALETAEVLASA